ncbi:DUF4124 domain-containing protein [Agrilutibacter solisilvae]|uniref:DUF4124 domain-containing protein n=1 Tax=Agrilutibacter solisilvae TaxID=2763317 RepID=A0A974XZP9_9GAMM|nr:DUF4124 domain-containing protein [Lysobacter solisilvae]QSX78598.1 DUF4124 domain-containing protein [Lysobacter solisilvae]
MTLRATAPLVLLSLSLGLLTTSAAKAEVRRCETPSGQTVFTDRKCTDIGATQRVPNVAGNTPARMYRGGCARNLQDLVFEITTAIDAKDANRLAGVYHWAGMSGTAGYQVWSRLDTIARRPLVDIVPVMPSAPPVSIPLPPPPAESAAAPADPLSYSSPDAPAPAAPVTTNSAPDPQLYPQTTIRRAPVALRLEQTLGATATPARTVFGLVRHFGCWWVRL